MSYNPEDYAQEAYEDRVGITAARLAEEEAERDALARLNPVFEMAIEGWVRSQRIARKLEVA